MNEHPLLTRERSLVRDIIALRQSEQATKRTADADLQQKEARLRADLEQSIFQATQQLTVAQSALAHARALLHQGKRLDIINRAQLPSIAAPEPGKSLVSLREAFSELEGARIEFNRTLIPAIEGASAQHPILRVSHKIWRYGAVLIGVITAIYLCRSATGLSNSWFDPLFTAIATAMLAAIPLYFWSKNRQASQLLALYEAVLWNASKVEQYYNSAVSELNQNYQQQVSNLRSSATQQSSSQVRTSGQRWAQLKASVDALQRDATALSPPWTDGTWQNWRPQGAQSGVLCRLGTFYIATSPNDGLQLPAIITFPRTPALIIKTGHSGKQSAVAGIQSLILRMLVSQPPGKVRLTFIDTESEGRNAAHFVPLADFEKSLVTTVSWTNSGEVEGHLANLVDFVRSHNLTGGTSGPGANHVLVLIGVPDNMTEYSARYLESLVNHGPASGVHVVILINLEKDRALKRVNLQELEKSAQVIAWNHQTGGFQWEGSELQHARLTFDTLPDSQLQTRILTELGHKARGADDISLEHLFRRAGEYQVRNPQKYPDLGSVVDLTDTATWWRDTYTTRGLVAPIGVSDNGRAVFLEVGQDDAPIHGLIAGATNSGKTNLLHVLITSLAIMYGPDQVEMYLVDFKGVGFKRYIGRLPHARVIAVDADREYGLSILKLLQERLTSRRGRFSEVGADSMETYREKTRGIVPRERVPRLLLLMDEFQVLFSIEDKIKAEALDILDSLVRLGRSFGIHVLLCSQTVSAGGRSIRGSTLRNMALRIALKCDPDDEHFILSDDNRAARQIAKRGDAIYNPKSGSRDGNVLVHVANADENKVNKYLDQLSGLARTRARRHPSPQQIVFDGNDDANIERNERIRDLLKDPRPATTNALQYAWLGEPIEIKEPTVVAFGPQRGDNLLIVGGNGQAGLGMLSSAMASLALQQHEPARDIDQPFIFVLDFANNSTPTMNHWSDIAGRLGGRVKVGSKRDTGAFIQIIHDGVARRSSGGLADECMPPQYLVLSSFQNARDLRLELDKYGKKTPNQSSQSLFNILKSGPEVNVHVLLWCDSLANLKESLPSELYKEFTWRVAFQMSEDDSTRLIDRKAASTLGTDNSRCLLFNEAHANLEKFRPYTILDATRLLRIEEDAKSRRAANLASG